MQSADSREKITALVLLAASTMFGALAYDLGPLTDPPETGAAPGKLFMAAALAGSLIAILMLLSPGKDHRSLRTMLREFWPQLAGLVVLVIGYALTLEPLGFFFSTSLFLVLGCLLLGERRWGLLVILALPVAAALQLMMHGMFGVRVADPLMRALGVIA